jgi:hypothetical protein
MHASRSLKDFTNPPPPYQAALSHQYSVASFATLRALICLHSPGLHCSCCNVVRYCCDLKALALAEPISAKQIQRLLVCRLSPRVMSLGDLKCFRNDICYTFFSRLNYWALKMEAGASISKNKPGDLHLMCWRRLTMLPSVRSEQGT